MKLLAAALALTFAVAAQAQDDVGTGMAADLAGDWQIVPVGGTPACTVTFGLAPVQGGWGAKPDPLCAANVPAAAAATAWTFMDGFHLLDARGETLMRFEEDETALPASPSVAAPAHYLVPAIPGFERLRQPDEWEGPWQVSAKGEKPCILHLGPPGQHRGGSVSVRRCRSAALRRMNRWYVEGMRLMLAGPDDTQIAFTPDGADTHRSDDGRWRLGHWPAQADKR